MQIHKPNNPRQPVVSSVNSHMEKLSTYVNTFLRLLAEKLLSHITNTTDFIRRLKVLGWVPENSILVTLDVSSLYTNIDTDEGLTIVKEELQKNGPSNPSAETLTCLLEKVPKLNSFALKDENFIQVKGTAMGTRAVPNFANVYIGQLEDKFVYQTEWFNYNTDWVRFVDDIFLIWEGSKDSLTAFIEYLKSAVSLIKFMYEILYSSVNFLDTKVKEFDGWHQHVLMCARNPQTPTHTYTGPWRISIIWNTAFRAARP